MVFAIETLVVGIIILGVAIGAAYLTICIGRE